MNETGLKIGMGLFLALGAVAAFLYARGVAPAAVAAAGRAVNPLNPDNIFAQGANALTQTLTGSKVDTVGTWLASGYSDRVGEETVAPVAIGDRHGSGLDMGLFLGGYVGDLPLASDVPAYIGPGGAAFGIYPKP